MASDFLDNLFLIYQNEVSWLLKISAHVLKMQNGCFLHRVLIQSLMTCHYYYLNALLCTKPYHI
jgi:hypothetical protein